MGAVDRSEQKSLVFPGGDAASSKIHVAGAEDGEQDPSEYRQPKEALLQPADFDPEGLFDGLGVPEGVVEGDDLGKRPFLAPGAPVLTEPASLTPCCFFSSRRRSAR